MTAFNPFRCTTVALTILVHCSDHSLSPQVMSLNELKHLLALRMLRVLNLLHNPVEVLCVYVCVYVCVCVCVSVCVTFRAHVHVCVQHTYDICVCVWVNFFYVSLHTTRVYTCVLCVCVGGYMYVYVYVLVCCVVHDKCWHLALWILHYIIHLNSKCIVQQGVNGCQSFHHSGWGEVINIFSWV
jgi:hypothetical protein